MSLKSIMIEHVEAVFVNAEHFGESVIFHAPAGDETVVCLVRIDGPSRDNEGDDQTIFTGEIDIPDAHVSALAIDGVLPALTIQDRERSLRTLSGRLPGDPGWRRPVAS